MHAPNTTLVDGWSWGHLAWGFALGVLGLRYPTFLALHVTYDAGEQLVERTRWGQRLFDTKGPENLTNIAGDTLVASFGWWVGQRVRRR